MDGMSPGFLVLWSAAMNSHGGFWFVMGGCESCGVVLAFAAVLVRHEMQNVQESVCRNAGEEPREVLVVDGE